MGQRCATGPNPNAELREALCPRKLQIEGPRPLSVGSSGRPRMQGGMLPVGVSIASSFMSSIACRTICCTANRVSQRSALSGVRASRAGAGIDDGESERRLGVALDTERFDRRFTRHRRG